MGAGAGHGPEKLKASRGAIAFDQTWNDRRRPALRRPALMLAASAGIPVAAISI